MPLTDTRQIIQPQSLPRPGYLKPVVEAGFGTTLTRICGDTNATFPLDSTWGLDARHGYSRRQPWNSDMSLAMLEQRGGTPSKFIVNARNWAPILGNRGTSRVSRLLDSCTEVRWMPAPHASSVMVGLQKTAQTLVIFDVLSEREYLRIPIGHDVGFMGEASLSNDGTMVALGNISNAVVLVNLVDAKVSALQRVDFIRSPGHALGNVTVSPLATPAGGKVVVKASDTPEIVHVYGYGRDLMLTHHLESALTLSHADVGVTPAGREVFCGDSRSWFGPRDQFSDKDGSVVAIDLEDGRLTHISAGSNQTGKSMASAQHCSCRGPKGWVLATHVGPHENSGLFNMQLIAWKLDGSRDAIRFGVTRSNETGIYRAEAHGVPSPSGRQVMFASNWMHSANPIGSPNDIKSYVLSLDDGIIDPPPPPTSPRFYVDSSWQYSPPGGIIDRVTGKLVALPEIAKLLNGIKT